MCQFKIHGIKFIFSENTFVDKDKDKDKDKDWKIPNMCYILEKQALRRYQIWYWEGVKIFLQKVFHQFVPSCDPKKLEPFLIHLLLLYLLLHFFAKMPRKLDDYPLLWRLPGCTKFPEVPELDCLTTNTLSSSSFTLSHCPRLWHININKTSGGVVFIF